LTLKRVSWRSHVSEFLEEGKMILGEQIKPEMIQSMVEVGNRNLQKHSGSARGHHRACGA